MSFTLPANRWSLVIVLVGVMWPLAQAKVSAAPGAPCQRCGWTPPKTRNQLTVYRMAELREALGHARPGTTILLADGVYPLDRMLDLNVSDLVLRGLRGDRSRVVIRGERMDEQKVGVAVSVSAAQVTVADMTIMTVGFHGIQVRGESKADRAVIHNVRIVDTGQQLIKGSMALDGRGPNEGLVACSSFEYSDHAPSNYTNGVDILGGKNWIVRDNVFRRIRGPREENWASGPSVLFWKKSQDTLVERNFVIDCFRGIALGLGSGEDGQESFDHRGGVIRNNVVCNLNSWADEGIETNGSPGTRIEHNTVLVEGHMPWSISVRFPTSSATAWNNLTNRPIVARDGARVELKGDVIDAQRDWFVDPGRANLRLARDNVPAIDKGIPIPDIRRDLDLKPRLSGKAPDAGAFEFVVTGDNRTE